jgi:uncharacterized membrane protein YesL
MKHHVVPAPIEVRWRLSSGATVRRGVRAAWDALGLVCAASATVFASLALPPMVGLRLGALLRTGWVPGVLAAVALVFVAPPLYAGACVLAHRAMEHDSPSYGTLWEGARRLYGRSVALGAVEALVALLLAANTAFYLTRHGLAWRVAGVFFVYLLLFWLTTCLYHWPLLVAGHVGLIRRDDGGTPGVVAVLRNAFLLAASAPGYSVALAAAALLANAVLAASGVGLVLLSAGATAFLSTQATRDQLVRFGVMPPPPDLDAPAEDHWRLT